MPTSLPPLCAARFRVDRVHATGGFGTVFLATQLQLDRQVALKLLHHDVLVDPSLVERFRDEARLTAALRHPAIVQIVDHDVENGLPWIAYEYLEGSTLAEVLKHGPMPSRTALKVAASLASALAAAHQQGILHRDVKPHNIMEAGEGCYKLVDFGLAKWSGASRELTETGDIVGTPAYMSPEQLQGESATPSSDIYSLGVVLFQMLTGQHPYGFNPIEMFRLQALGELPSPSRVRPDLPPHVDELVARAMALRPADRWPDAATFARELDRDALRSGRHRRPAPVRISEMMTVHIPPAPRHVPRARVALGTLAVVGLLAGAFQLTRARPVAKPPGSSPKPAPALATLTPAERIAIRERLRELDQANLTRGGMVLSVMQALYSVDGDFAAGGATAARLESLLSTDVATLSASLGLFEERFHQPEAAGGEDLALWLATAADRLKYSLRAVHFGQLAAVVRTADPADPAGTFPLILEETRRIRSAVGAVPAVERVLDLAGALAHEIVKAPERHGHLVRDLIGAVAAVANQLRHSPFATPDHRRIERRFEILTRQLDDSGAVAGPLELSLTHLWSLGLRRTPDYRGELARAQRSLTELAKALPGGSPAILAFAGDLARYNSTFEMTGPVEGTRRPEPSSAPSPR